MKNLFKLFAVAVLAVALAPLSAWASASMSFAGWAEVDTSVVKLQGDYLNAAIFTLGGFYYISTDSNDNTLNWDDDPPPALPERFYRLSECNIDDGLATLTSLTQYTMNGVAIVLYEVGSFSSDDFGATWKHGSDGKTYYIVPESGSVTNFSTHQQGFAATYDSAFNELNPTSGVFRQNIVYSGKEGYWFNTEDSTQWGSKWYDFIGGYFVDCDDDTKKYNANGESGGTVTMFWEDESNPGTWTNKTGVVYLKAGDFYYNDVIGAYPAKSQYNADEALVQAAQTEGVFTCAYTDIVNQVWRKVGDTETEYTKKNVNGTVAFTANGDTVKKNADGTDLLQSGSFVYSAAVKKWFIAGDDAGYDKYGMYFSKDGSNYVNNAGTAVQITILDIVSTSFENILTAPIVKKAVTSGLTDDGVTQTAAAFTEKSYFYVSGTNDESYVTNAVPSFAVPVTRPDYFSTDGQTALLQLQTQGDTLYRTFAAVTNTLIDQQAQWTNGVSTVNVSSKGTYLDMLVQLTPTDEAPEMSSLAADQKFALWLQEFDDGENPATTNLCVYAGTLAEDGALGTPRVYKIVTPDGLDLSATSWHRLTVKMKQLETGSVLGFQLYLDSMRLAATENALTNTETAVSATSFNAAEKKLLESKSLFPSLRGSSVALNAVGFQGSGAVDDFAVTETAPEITKWSFTLVWNPTLMTAVKWSVNSGTSVSAADVESGSQTIRVLDDDKITVSYVDLQYADGYGPGRWAAVGAVTNAEFANVPYPATPGGAIIRSGNDRSATYVSGRSFVPTADGARATLVATNLAEVTVSVSNLTKIALWWPQWQAGSDTGVTNTYPAAGAETVTLHLPIDWIVDVRTNALTLRKNSEFHFAAGQNVTMNTLTDNWKDESNTPHTDVPVGKRFVVDALLNPSFTVAGVITAYDFILNWDKTKLNAVAYTVNGGAAVVPAFEAGTVTNTYSCKGGAPVVTLTDGTTAKDWYVVAGFDVKAGTSVTNGHTMTLTSDTTADVLVVPATSAEETGASQKLQALIGTGMDVSQFAKWAAEVANKTVDQMNELVEDETVTNLIEEAYLLNVGLLEESTVMTNTCSVVPRIEIDGTVTNKFFDVTLKLNAKVLLAGADERTNVQLGEDTTKKINGRIVVRGWEIDDEAGTIRCKEAAIPVDELKYDDNGDANITINEATENLFQISIER